MLDPSCRSNLFNRQPIRPISAWKPSSDKTLKENYIYTPFVVEILKAQRREDKTAVGTTLPPLTTATMKVDSSIFDSRSKESSKMSPDIDVTRSPLTDVRVGETTVKDWTDAEERKVRRK